MKKNSYRRFLVFQAIVGGVLTIIGLWFPMFVYEKYGLTYQNLYGVDGHVKGHVIYFFYGLAMGGLSIILGISIFALARYYMRRDHDPGNKARDA